MNILIAGGTGLIGRHLSTLLIQKGHRLSILTRQDIHTLKTSLQVPVTYINWIQEDIDTTLAHTDVIVNLSGAPIFSRPWTSTYKKLLYSSRLEPLAKLTHGIKKSPDKKRIFIQASASGYYGSYPCQKKESPFIESHNSGQDFLAKLAKTWEENLTQLEEENITITILRLGIVLANDGGAFPKLILPFKLFTGGPLGLGKQPFAWIHIDDVCQAVLHLINQPSSGAYNLSTPDYLTNKEFAKKLGHYLSRPSFIPIPSPILNLFLGQRSILLLKGQYQDPTKLIQTGYSFQYPTLDQALASLLRK